MAELIFRYGTMASGKSLHLLATAYNFKENKIKYQLLKPSIDTRTKDEIYSRIGVSEKCTILPKNEDIWKYIDFESKWILVDESQFLTYIQIDELAQIVDKHDINIICYGLRTDYLTHLFEGSKRLFEIADKFEELPSYCSCGDKTSVNAKINKDGEIEIIDNGEQIEIGGDERYKAICRSCFFEKVIEYTSEVCTLTDEE